MPPESKAFTLGLWKHIHTSRLQREHSIEDTVVEDIVPLTAAALLNRPENDEETAPTISDRIKVQLPSVDFLVKEMTPETILQELAVKTGHGEEETSLPLPMDYIFYKFKPSERRTLYNYAVEASPMRSFLKFFNTQCGIICTGYRQTGLNFKGQRVGP